MQQSAVPSASAARKSIRLDPTLGEAFLASGNSDADDGNLPMAISSYQSAIRVNPRMEEAHYRLAMAYRKTGEAGEGTKRT